MTIPWVRYEGLPIGAVFLCELTVAPVVEGRCSVHGGVACLRRYDHSEETEPLHAERGRLRARAAALEAELARVSICTTHGIDPDGCGTQARPPHRMETP